MGRGLALTAVFLLSTLCHVWAGGLENMLEEMDEKEFEEFFDLDPVDDPEEFAKRQDALSANEKRVKQVNQEYAEGKKTWFDAINEFSNLPEDEFLQGMTGLVETVPDEYSAVDEGHVSPVKSQGGCGSCVAFASMSSVETCFKKITGVFGDYSEQQMVDCGYHIDGAYACDGAVPHVYLKRAGDNQIKFANESQYPYTASLSQCPDNPPVFNQGAQISGSYYTYNGDEELLKKMVYTHGSVLACVHVNREMQLYKGGIFSGCSGGERINHAISVVGYGSENGKDFWLIKNSWGTWWGDDGYIKLERGSQMCGIGPMIAATECESSSDAPVTDPTTTTPATTTVDPSCVDAMKDCDYFSAHWCWDKFIKKKCKYSCGLCKGQDPAESTYSFDKYSNCDAVADLCQKYRFVSKRCKKTCSEQNP